MNINLLKTRLKKAILPIVLILLLLSIPAAYFGLEKLILAKMALDLRATYGDDYAILCMRMGGEAVDEPDLKRFLELLYEYNFNEEYEPKGSGGFTGKNNYLFMLVTDNRTVREATWSFRRFELVIDDNPYACDIIGNLDEKSIPIYTYEKENRVKKGGMWCQHEPFNGPGLDFYMRRMKYGQEPYSDSIRLQNIKGTFNGQVDNPVKIYRFIARVKQTLMNSDAEAFVNLVHFPLPVTHNGKTLIYEYPEDLVHEFPVLFTDTFRREIIEEPLTDMTASWRGIGLADGRVWISDHRAKINSLKITVITTEIPQDDRRNIVDAEFYRKDGRETIQPLNHPKSQVCVDNANLPFRQYREDDPISYLATTDPDIGGAYLVYKADINNDGSDEIIMANYGAGSGGHSWTKYIYTNASDIWMEMSYLELYRKAFLPKRTGINWGTFQSHMARPFLYKKDGKVYHGFDDWNYYLWEDDQLVKIPKTNESTASREVEQ